MLGFGVRRLILSFRAVSLSRRGGRLYLFQERIFTIDLCVGVLWYVIKHKGQVCASLHVDTLVWGDEDCWTQLDYTPLSPHHALERDAGLHNGTQGLGLSGNDSVKHALTAVSIVCSCGNLMEEADHVVKGWL